MRRHFGREESARRLAQMPMLLAIDRSIRKHRFRLPGGQDSVEYRASQYRMLTYEINVVTVTRDEIAAARREGWRARRRRNGAWPRTRIQRRGPTPQPAFWARAPSLSDFWRS